MWQNPKNSYILHFTFYNLQLCLCILISSSTMYFSTKNKAAVAELKAASAGSAHIEAAKAKVSQTCVLLKQNNMSFHFSLFSMNPHT